MPTTIPGPNVLAREHHVAEALQILQSAIDDPEVHATTSRDANESADAYAQRDRDAKKSVVVAVLADLLQEVTTFGTPDDANLLRATIDQYYAEWNADNPGHELEQVPYLVRTGRRKQAVELTTRQEYWQVASVTTLATACGAVLADLEKRLLVPDARAAGTPGSKDAVAASDMEEVKLQAAAIEEVLQIVLGKCRSEYASAQTRDQVDKSNAVAAILSLLANHFFNTGHVDPQRYQRAADLYTEILTLQPINVEAIRNRAAISAASGENLSTALAQIDRALETTGPLPIILDTRAMILLASGRPEEALEVAQQVIGERPDRLDPAKDKELAKDWGQYYFHLALTYDANANRAEAVKAFQEAVRLGFGETDVAALERAKWQQLIASTGS